MSHIPQIQIEENIFASVTRRPVFQRFVLSRNCRRCCVNTVELGQQYVQALTTYDAVGDACRGLQLSAFRKDSALSMQRTYTTSKLLCLLPPGAELLPSLDGRPNQQVALFVAANAVFLLFTFILAYVKLHFDPQWCEGGERLRGRRGSPSAKVRMRTKIWCASAY